MDQQDLWHDSLEEAQQAAVIAIGGPKKVGAMLWPTMKITDAARKLNHCLDPERPEKLSAGEFELLGQCAREASCHTIMAYLARRWGYQKPLPIQPEDEQAKLMRDFIAMGKQMEKISEQMQHMTQLKAVVSK